MKDTWFEACLLLPGPLLLLYVIVRAVWEVLA